MILCSGDVYIMKKNSFISFIIMIFIVGIIVAINYVGIIKNSILTCSNNKKEIKFLFDSKGIKNIRINNKLASKEELIKYKLLFASDFAWNNMYENKSYLDKVKMHMKRVDFYFKTYYDYECNYKE